MDDHYAPGPVAGWFTIAAIASLLFMAVGCAGVILHATTDAAKLPLDQRALFEAEPAWVLAASTVAFAAGLAGAILLLLQRATAVPVLLVSLLGFLLWVAGMFLTPRFRDLLSTDQIAVVLGVVAIAWTIFWFARHSRQRGWLK